MSILVGQKAPDFIMPAVLGSGEIMDEFRFLEAKGDRYAVLCFYPLDFTFVCPTELIALESRFTEFEKRAVLVVAISVDSQYTHHAWRNTPIEQGGIGPVRFVLGADVAHRVCREYGVKTCDGVCALRASFLIDREGVVRHQVVNDLSLGRDMDELLRMVDALQFHEANGEVCPAGWREGQPGIAETPAGVVAYLTEHAATL